MAKSDLFVSVVTRVRDAAGTVGPALERLSAIMEARFAYYEIVVVDDASRDATPAAVARVQQFCRNIQFYGLARGKGDYTALIAGLDHAIGDVVVTLDLNTDPPDLIPKMVEMAAAGADIVYALPRERLAHPGLYNRLLNGVMAALARMNRLDVPVGISNYRLVTRAVLNFMLDSPGRHRTLMLLPALSGYPYRSLEYDRLIDHTAGPRPRRRQAMLRAIELALSLSAHPLRIVSLMALGLSGINLAYAVYAVLVGLFLPDVAKGWTSLSLQISGLFCIVCLILAVLSEYILQILEATSQKAPYHISRQSLSATVRFAGPSNVVTPSAPSTADTAGGPPPA